VLSRAERQIIQHGKNRYRLPRGRLRLLDRWVVDVVVAAARVAAAVLAGREVDRGRCYLMMRRQREHQRSPVVAAVAAVAAAAVVAVASAVVKMWCREEIMVRNPKKDVRSEEDAVAAVRDAGAADAVRDAAVVNIFSI